MSTIAATARTGAPASSMPALLARGLVAPFDLARDVHAQAVEAGLIERSMLESAKFEHQLDVLEHLMLGPFARRR